MRRTLVAAVLGLVFGACEPVPSPELPPSNPRSLTATIAAIPLAPKEAPPEEPAPTGPWDQLEPRIVLAKSQTLIRESSKPYSLGSYFLRSHQRARALEALTSTRARILGDRIALAEAEAQVGLRDLDAAKRAYERALESAQIPSLSQEAALGLVEVLRKKNEREPLLRLLEAMLERADAPEHWDLALMRAEVLAEVHRDEEAWDAAAYVMEAYPSGAKVLKAQQIQKRLKTRGLRRPISKEELQVWQVAACLRAGDGAGARRLLGRIRGGGNVDRQTIDLLQAEILEQRRSHREERALLSRLYESVAARDRPRILLRLSELERGRKKSKMAELVAELVDQYPDTHEAAAARLLLVSEPFEQGRFMEASSLSAELLESDPSPDDAEAARWLAAWSAFLAGENGQAIGLFEEGASSAATATEEIRLRYWLGRVYERSGASEDAKIQYQRAVEIAPLRYYGLSAGARLEALGARVPIDKPKSVPSTATFADVAAILGPDRPIGVDRAASFAEGGLPGHALEELLAVAAYYRGRSELLGQGVAADLAAGLGSERSAFYAAIHAGDSTADLLHAPDRSWRALVRAYPMPYLEAVATASKAHDVEAPLIWAIMRTESHFDENARSSRGARGLMQLLPATAFDIGRKAKGGTKHARQYRAPSSNIWLGSWYLRFLMDRYDGKMEPAIGAYNAGPGAMDGWLKSMGPMEPDVLIERVPYDETRAYLRRVMESVLIYRLLAQL